MIDFSWLVNPAMLKFLAIMVTILASTFKLGIMIERISESFRDIQKDIQSLKNENDLIRKRLDRIQNP